MKIQMKKSLLGALLTALMLVGCGGDNAQSSTESSPAPVETKADEKLQNYTVGIDISYPPFTSRDENGKPTGFEVEILQAIADDQKFSIDLMHAPRNTLFPDLQKGKYQILSASLKANPERAEQSELTEGYAQSYRAILSRKDKVANSGKDLATAGSVAVQEATNSEREVTELGGKIKAYSSLFEAFQAFMSGKTDHIVGDSVSLGYYLHQHAKDKVGDYTFTHFDDEGNKPILFAVTKGNTELLNKVNTGLNNLKQNGKYDAIYDKYFADKSASVNQK